MKSICKKVYISPLFLFIIFLSFISGLFKDVIILFIVIIIHELGHIFFSYIYKWNIKKVDITICGGFISFDDVIDKPLKEEFIISMAGFLFQFLLFVTCICLYNFNIIDIKLFSLIAKYNLSIFLFNVLPIYPLDGSKILFVIFNLFISYKKSLKLINTISFINVFLIIFIFLYFKIKFEYSYIMIFVFINKKLFSLLKNIPYLFNRFLFERYLFGINTKKIVYIKNGNLNLFRRGKKHYFKIGNHYYDEKAVLKKRFD